MCPPPPALEVGSGLFWGPSLSWKGLGLQKKGSTIKKSKEEMPSMRSRTRSRSRVGSRRNRVRSRSRSRSLVRSRVRSRSRSRSLVRSRSRSRSRGWARRRLSRSRSRSRMRFGTSGRMVTAKEQWLDRPVAELVDGIRNQGMTTSSDTPSYRGPPPVTPGGRGRRW